MFYHVIIYLGVPPLSGFVSLCRSLAFIPISFSLAYIFRGQCYNSVLSLCTLSLSPFIPSLIHNKGILMYMYMYMYKCKQCSYILCISAFTVTQLLWWQIRHGLKILAS